MFHDKAKQSTAGKSASVLRTIMQTYKHRNFLSDVRVRWIIVRHWTYERIKDCVGLQTALYLKLEPGNLEIENIPFGKWQIDHIQIFGAFSLQTCFLETCNFFASQTRFSGRIYALKYHDIPNPKPQNQIWQDIWLGLSFSYFPLHFFQGALLIGCRWSPHEWFLLSRSIK